MKPEIQYETKIVARYRPCPEDMHEFTIDGEYGYCSCGQIASFHEGTATMDTKCGNYCEVLGPVQQLLEPEGITNVLNSVQDLLDTYTRAFLDSDEGPVGALAVAMDEL